MLVGYGRMGKEIEAIALKRGHRISRRFDAEHPATGAEMSGDVVIDFSTADALFFNVSLAFDNGLPIVVGSTGWNDKLPALRALVEQLGASLIYSSNFSPGMQIFQRVVRRAAELANTMDDYDLVLHEWHHRHKADSPSGTALSLAEIVLSEVERKTQLNVETSHGVINPSDLHLTSSRVGSVPGTHMLMVDSDADSIELWHRAKNRQGFALGSVLAAEWIVSHPGFHEFAAVFDQLLRDLHEAALKQNAQGNESPQSGQH